MMHFAVDGQDCWVRGRIDATVISEVPRIIDYKYARWKEGAESGYEVQIMTYALALMKALDVERAIGEIWYVKSPMKIVRREYTRQEAEDRLTALLKKYLTAISIEEWPRADRSYCDRVECGFRSECWSAI
jgi:CRISPR/Cas system-associated exonuclease Cas4 (RecB family)